MLGKTYLDFSGFQKQLTKFQTTQNNAVKPSLMLKVSLSGTFKSDHNEFVAEMVAMIQIRQTGRINFGH